MYRYRYSSHRTYPSIHSFIYRAMSIGGVSKPSRIVWMRMSSSRDLTSLPGVTTYNSHSSLELWVSLGTWVLRTLPRLYDTPPDARRRYHWLNPGPTGDAIRTPAACQMVSKASHGLGGRLDHNGRMGCRERHATTDDKARAFTEYLRQGVSSSSAATHRTDSKMDTQRRNLSGPRP
ncbi:hypothetical protein P170DRAFT_31590 [Aspergillus steynii IBT 23096]|uniref:Uncharacterized protein n=1 Tax=Aspergillus steynii IBT 23096 TaxID=1392250 RepID=A0A2I2GQB7_9EURO|nr:uncharacterized protein P170DRAFT_31590 [Aspergillus steynii IBT 23096]PLB55067.1 hypothetical protein P170DRAFT_31590 [Aspergillus steynii IBT 23096]